jgi:formylglycine-generating enzyme required for sulfatase activity
MNYVTVAEYNKYLEATKTKTNLPAHWNMQLGNNNFPVTGVSALEADAYCAWAGGRLPTSDELKDHFCPLWEWTSTEKNGLRVLRGGSFNSDSWILRASNRYWVVPGYWLNLFGFRCVQDIPK